LLDEFDGAATAVFEFSGCSFESHVRYCTGVQEKRAIGFAGLSMCGKVVQKQSGIGMLSPNEVLHLTRVNIRDSRAFVRGLGACFRPL
jgi:hypothetical protein